MAAASFLSITDQVAEHLRAEILRGRWSGAMPGKHQLAAELGINNKTVEAALRQLEKVGLLIPQGAGRKRLIAPRRRESSRTLRIAYFLNEGMQDQKSELHIKLIHALTDAGHTVTHAEKSLSALCFDVKRVAGVVRQTKADAWIISAGSRAVLAWFAGQRTPAFALFGHRAGLDIAAVGPDKFAAVEAATRHLIGLGHRRIVLLCRRLRRLPQPGLSETLFLETLREHGCAVGEYNLPDWDDTDAGFQECLNALFRVTPPTALIVDEAPYFIATMQFLLSRGIRVPQEVSLVCTDDDPAFAHCSPPIARITYDPGPVVRRIVHWAANVSRGKPDLRQTFTPSQFIPGGTIGQAPTSPGSRRADLSG
jgi:DNA-binding LacI/PurR family transcriptional regulator